MASWKGLIGGIAGHFTAPEYERSHFLRTLDGWRAIAIGAVLLGHGVLNIPRPSGVYGTALGLIGEHVGPQGVSLFFAISGFLITTRLLLEFEKNGGISLRSFYLRRVFRILPAAVLYLAVIAVLGTLGWIAASRGEILAALFFYSNYWTPTTPYTSHFWSLSMEEHFYLLWPPVLFFLGARKAAWFAALLAVATVIWRAWAAQVLPLKANFLERTDVRLDAFLFACLLSILLRTPQCSGLARWLADRRVFWAMVAAVAAVYAAVSLHHERQMTKELMVSVLFPPILAATVLRPGDWLGRMLEWTPLAWIGRISYSIYIWHAPFRYRVRSWSQFLLFLVLSLLAATASYYLIERPLIATGRPLAAAKPTL